MKDIIQQIYESGLKFLVPLDLDETYKVIVQEAMKLTGAQYGSVFLEKNGELERVYASSPVLFKIKPRRRGITYNVYKTKKPVILTSKQIEKIHPEFEETRARSDIIVPLTNQGKSIGVLTIQSVKDRNFTDKDFDILKLFVPMASLAIRKNQLYGEVKKALETRDLFISMAAHELRTPLTTVNGYVQLLKNKSDNFGPIEARWIEELSWEVHRLTLLTKELLEVERIKSGNLQYVFRECLLTEIVDRAIKNIVFEHPHKTVDFVNKLVTGEDKVVADFDKLLQAINNILENAAKYSDSSQVIRIKLEKNARFVVLSVTDKGRGFTADDLHKVFEKFYRGTNHNREGMGLGLYLAREIVREHKGDVKITSKEGRGTKVKLLLPSMGI